MKTAEEGKTAYKALRVLALATEWGVSQGGVSVWNLEFCRALSRAGHRVTCGLVSDFGRTLTDEVASIVDVQYGPTRALLDDSFDLIVGHGLHTGPYARYYRDEYFASARYVHVQHVDHVIEHDKHDSDSSKIDAKEDKSRDLLAASDLPVGVGPRLSKVAERLLSSYPMTKRVTRLDPGVPTFILNAEPRKLDRIKTKILLTIGRADDWHLKGFDIAAKVASLLPSSQVDCLRVRGVKNSQKDDLKRTLKSYLHNKSLQLDLRTFEGPDRVLLDLAEADCVLLPSRREGFGLSAFESLSLGVPTLVTHASGLADLLKEICSTEISSKIVVESDDERVWKDRVLWAIAPENAAVFHEVRETLIQSCCWSREVQKVVEAMHPSLLLGD